MELVDPPESGQITDVTHVRDKLIVVHAAARDTVVRLQGGVAGEACNVLVRSPDPVCAWVRSGTGDTVVGTNAPPRVVDHVFTCYWATADALVVL